jgi:hypothetical protein
MSPANVARRVGSGGRAGPMPISMFSSSSPSRPAPSATLGLARAASSATRSRGLATLPLSAGVVRSAPRPASPLMLAPITSSRRPGVAETPRLREEATIADRDSAGVVTQSVHTRGRAVLCSTPTTQQIPGPVRPPKRNRHERRDRERFATPGASRGRGLIGDDPSPQFRERRGQPESREALRPRRGAA